MSLCSGVCVVPEEVRVGVVADGLGRSAIGARGRRGGDEAGGCHIGEVISRGVGVCTRLGIEGTCLILEHKHILRPVGNHTWII